MTIPVNQVVTAATGYGHVAHCGCGWRSVHDTATGRDAAGERHTRTAHALSAPEQLTLIPE